MDLKVWNSMTKEQQELLWNTLKESFGFSQNKCLIIKARA